MSMDANAEQSRADNTAPLYLRDEVVARERPVQLGQ